MDYILFVTGLYFWSPFLGSKTENIQSNWGRKTFLLSIYVMFRFDMSCNGTENATPSSDQDSPSPESEHAKQIPPPTNNKSNHLPSDQTSNGQLPKDDNQKHNQLDNLQNGDVSLPRDSILRAKTHSFNPLLAEPNYMNGNNHQLSITSMEDDPNRARKINLVRHLLRHEADPGVPSLTELQQRRRSSVFRFNR